MTSSPHAKPDCGSKQASSGRTCWFFGGKIQGVVFAQTQSCPYRRGDRTCRDDTPRSGQGEVSYALTEPPWRERGP
jgi:hypothetical protein